MCRDARPTLYPPFKARQQVESPLGNILNGCTLPGVLGHGDGRMTRWYPRRQNQATTWWRPGPQSDTDENTIRRARRYGFPISLAANMWRNLPIERPNGELHDPRP